MPYITSTDLDTLGYDLSRLTADQITGICQTASVMVDNYILQPISPTVHTEYQTAVTKEGWLCIFPAYLPIISVDDLNMFTSPVSKVPLDISRVIINDNSGCVMIPALQKRGAKVQITYTHGYAVTPPQIVEATLMVAMRIIECRVSAKTAGYSEVSTLRDGVRSVSKEAKLEVPESAKVILNDFVRVR